MPPCKKQAEYKTSSNNNGSIPELMKELFQAAVNLRGSIEPSDYKRYVLPLIFLRFLSMRYEKRRAELEKMIAEPQSDYYQLEMVVNDPDEYRKVGAFVVPEDARWSNIRKQANADDIKVRLDNILANPPFNDGAKGENGWGASNISNKDPRLLLGGEKMPLSARNANPMWMLHFLYHLAEGGTAGFVMATGELSNSETARLEVRKALVEGGYVDCIVQLSGQLFANTQIPCTLWFLSKNRNGEKGFRKRTDEILFIDARKLGALMPGSRKQKQLTDEEVERLAAVYREFKTVGIPETISGLSSVAKMEEIRGHKYALSPGRYVGSANGEDDDIDFEERMPRLIAELKKQFAQSSDLEKAINANLEELGYGGG